ncbi:hypothetical protein B0H14DRAFT_2617368 [Mycena olivaceomarginata]|nr:hypothetical protein B0H14DRAFT_2617368 [Mycena olivaceomarginata]
MITPALLPLLLVAFALPSILAQVVSPYWRVRVHPQPRPPRRLIPTPRKPNITASPAERINLAGAALAEAVNQLNPAPQFFPNATGVAVAGCKGSFYGQMAEFDLITKQTMWEKSLKTYFQVAQSAHGNFSTTNVSLGYSISNIRRAAALAYAAYKDQTFLDYATQSWWFGRAYTLSQDDVSAGRISTKNISPLQECCQNRSSKPGPAETMVGGTFWLMDPVKPKLTPLSTGLSALLAEATSDQLYLQAAIESRKFIQAHLLNDRNIVLEAIYAPQNYSCGVINEIFPYNTGITIEGLSILAALTNDTETRNCRYRLEQILATAIPYSLWQGSDGVIAIVNQNNTRGSAQTTGDLNLVQGLAAAYARNATSVDMHAYIGHYLAVQFNAVVDLATVGGTNIYGSSWVGPPSSTYLGQDQTSALSALIAALVVAHDSCTVFERPVYHFPGNTSREGEGGTHRRGRSAARGSDPTELLTSSDSDQMVHPFTAQRRSSARFLTDKLMQQRPAPSLSNQQALQHRSDGYAVRISPVTTHPQNHEFGAEDPPPDYEGMSELHVQNTRAVISNKHSSSPTDVTERFPRLQTLNHILD